MILNNLFTHTLKRKIAPIVFLEGFTIKTFTIKQNPILENKKAIQEGYRKT